MAFQHLKPRLGWKSPQRCGDHFRNQRRFHDVILALGSVPLAVLEEPEPPAGR